MKKMYAFMVCMTVWGATLFAQTEADFETRADGGGVVITKYKGAGGDVVIPAAIGGKAVVGIGGRAFSGHKALAAALGCDIYFAHPYHSWERGLNEHTNGLIRQYLPKRTSFDNLTQRQLDRITAKINSIY